jgi:hypothetical protein
MLKVLFIDDQIERVEAAKAYLTREGDEFTWATEVPNNLEDYDIISFDNDLGVAPEKDVVIQLGKRLFCGNCSLANKIITVHSMNPVAAARIGSLCEGLGATNVAIVPFSRMLLGPNQL